MTPRSDWLDDPGGGLSIVDRSSAEAYGDCAWRARWIDEHHPQAGSLAQGGELVHHALGVAINAYRDQLFDISSADLAELVEAEIGDGPANLSPDALRAIRPSLWAWCRWICSMPPDWFVIWDGGAGEHSGQLAVDVADYRVRLTSEIDLLTLTAAEGLAQITDYKSGFRKWSESMVADSVQFQLHAWLVLENFPNLHAVRVSVWATRANAITHAVTFTRRDLDRIMRRMRSLLARRAGAIGLPLAEVTASPNPDICGICDCVRACPVVTRGKSVDVIATDPAAAVDWLVATTAALKDTERVLVQIVTERGESIRGESGAVYGVMPAAKPRVNLGILK